MSDKNVNKAFNLPSPEDPEFVNKMLGMVDGLREMFCNLIKSSNESTKNVYDGYNRTLDTLEKMLSNENLKFEERIQIIEKMQEITDKMDVKDSENKNFWLKLAGVVGGAVVLALGLRKDKKPKSPWYLPWEK